MIQLEGTVQTSNNVPIANVHLLQDNVDEIQQ